MLVKNWCNVKAPITLTILPIPIGICIYVLLARMMRIDPANQEYSASDGILDVLNGIAYFVLSFVQVFLLVGLLPIGLRMAQICEYHTGSGAWLFAGIFSMIIGCGLVFQLLMNPIGDEFFYSASNARGSPSPGKSQSPSGEESSDPEQDNEDHEEDHEGDEEAETGDDMVENDTEMDESGNGDDNDVDAMEGKDESV